MRFHTPTPLKHKVNLNHLNKIFFSLSTDPHNKFHIWAYGVFVETKTSLKDAKKVGLIILDVIKYYSQYVSEHAFKIIKSPIYK